MKGVQRIIRPGSDRNVNKLSDSLDADEDRDIYGTIAGESPQLVGMMRLLLNLQNEFCIKKWTVTTRDDKMVEKAR